MVLNEESAADADDQSSMIKSPDYLKNFGKRDMIVKSRSQVVNDRSKQKVNTVRPLVLNKAEKQRNYEIELANEALLKRMMKIVNVSKEIINGSQPIINNP